MARGDAGGKFRSNKFTRICAGYRIKLMIMTADSPACNGQAERTIGHMEKNALEARIPRPASVP